MSIVIKQKFDLTPRLVVTTLCTNNGFVWSKAMQNTVTHYAHNSGQSYNAKKYVRISGKLGAMTVFYEKGNGTFRRVLK